MTGKKFFLKHILQLVLLFSKKALYNYGQSVRTFIRNVNSKLKSRKRGNFIILAKKIVFPL